ncbi:ferredoxin-nitrate reductase [Dyadobacter jejuensis]|uniref:nitrate reductase (cytochrome) n=1 Tax=Dyadobacter jejuensis TaxID=1082580 RepID=A0A316BDN1_9BACT|nr:nitrate reductase [Dyadobacter jejuensis]PWJ60607.1 ferredoxin-nitrate reductase [Dyadobacter jejuensis]
MDKTEKFQSTCCYCGVGCGVVVQKQPNGQLTLTGDAEHPSNKGMLCSKGMNLHYTVMDQTDRILYPRMRYSRASPLQRVSWDEALERAAAVFATLIRQHGPDSVAFYVSGQCLTEEYYLVNKLIKGFIGSNNIDTNSRLCMSSAVVGYKLSLGEDSVPVCYDDIEVADVFLVTGANPAWCHPILWRRIEARKAANPHVKIICVDPRKTDTARSADLHLPISPGTDVLFNHALAKALIENGSIDHDFIQQHTDGFEDLLSLIDDICIQEAAITCGLPEEDIRQAAQWIGQAKGFLSLWTMGLNQSVIGVNKNLSLINLHLITGRIGSPGNGPFSLTGQPNAMGGRETGGLANILPAHRDVTNPAHRSHMEAFWQTPVPISEKPGLTATEIFEALDEGKLKALWIINTNPMVSMPDINRVEKAMGKAKFVVVQDISERADTVAHADLVLPAAGWLEKEGTMTNAERRITYLPKVMEAPGEALPDVEIIWKFAQKMGFKEAFSYTKAEDVYLEYARCTANTNIDITGVNYELLQRKRSIQWPSPKNHPAENGGTQRLFEDHQFFTNTKRAKIHAPPIYNESEKTDSEFPLVLTTGRIRDQWHTMTKTGRVSRLTRHIPKPVVQIHPADAEARNIQDGDLVVVQGRRGQVRLKAECSEDLRQGVCFLPMHWGKIAGLADTRANNLTNALVDPRSKEPDFKYTAVQVSRYCKPTERIIIVGAGSAGLGFINSYRHLNTTDSIQVFSKEIYPFYNRVLLPDYISGEQTWEQLVKLREDRFEAAGIRVHKGVSITHIDKKNRVVCDSMGQEHPYDRLILATGSKAFIPKGVPQLPGLFNMRSRLDADSLKPYLQAADARAVIVGGGILGLELAASLVATGCKVTVIQRSGRLMERQLDPIASELLYQELMDRGIEVFFNDEVATYLGTDQIEGLRLKSGRKIDCEAVILAIGTTPVTDLAEAAGLEKKRGVVVNDYLQTSDPHIFAIGEIAEWQGQMWGITLAAEQQAEALAHFIAGDIAQPYRGSTAMNILKMEGLHLCSIGKIDLPANDPRYEEIIFIDKAKRYYKKCIVAGDKLVGAILVGDKNEFSEFKTLIADGLELSEKRLQLLRSSQKAEALSGKIVCSCNNVGSGNLERAIAQGCHDFKALCQQTGAGTGCGSCRPEVRAILETHLEKVLA